MNDIIMNDDTSINSCSLTLYNAPIEASNDRINANEQLGSDKANEDIAANHNIAASQLDTSKWPFLDLKTLTLQFNAKQNWPNKRPPTRNTRHKTTQQPRPVYRSRQGNKCKTPREIEQQKFEEALRRKRLNKSPHVVAKPGKSEVAKQTIAAWADWIKERYGNPHWRLYLVTLAFRQLGTTEKGILLKMHEEVERIYSIFLTRVVRSPHSPYCRSRRPILIALHDRPVYKRQKESLKNVSVNDGLHMHGILIVPRKSRLRTSVKAHFADNDQKYRGSRVDAIHLKKVRPRDLFIVTDYALKSLKYGTASTDDMLIFPKGATEAPCQK